MNKQCHLLISEIEAYFREGILLSDGDCHFIRSTFSDPSLSELRTIISDPSNPDKDSLLELIFTPDEPLQMRIEDLMSEDVFQEKDEDDLTAYLTAERPVAMVFISGRKDSLSIKMPADYIQKFILHLRITKRLDRRIIDTVEQYLTGTVRQQVKVKLRNSNFNESRNKIDFLCAFLKTANGISPLFWISLDFLLFFLEEMSSESSIGYELFKRKQYYKEKIQQAITYEKQLRKSNMETMMMQGRRNQSINIVDLQEKIDIINYLQNITRAVHE